MYTDKDLRVSDAQVVTTTAFSTTAIDLGVARELGEGEKIRAYFTVDEDVTAVGGATVVFEIIGSTDAGRTAGVVILGRSNAIPKANLTLDRDPIVIEINPEVASLGRQFLSARYTIANGPLDTGKFTCDFVTDIQGNFDKNYPSGFTVIG